MEEIITAEITDDHKKVIITVPLLPVEMTKKSNSGKARLIAVDSAAYWQDVKGAPFRFKITMIAPVDWRDEYGEITWDDWKRRE